MVVLISTQPEPSFRRRYFDNRIRLTRKVVGSTRNAGVRRSYEHSPTWLQGANLRDGTAISAQDLVVGMEFIVAPGERVATDGEVIEGLSSVDASQSTGESTPIEVAPDRRSLEAPERGRRSGRQSYRCWRRYRG